MTDFGVMAGSALGPVTEPPKFVADHPFAFFIVKEDSILFTGKYY